MDHLHQVLAGKVGQWREGGYACEVFPSIAEILEYQVESEEARDGVLMDTLRFLREPQRHALETYWYLRLIEKTPHISALYAQMFPSISSRRNALGLTNATLQDIILDEGLDRLLERIKTDDALVSDHNLDPLRETLTLDYPSYIFALAMGAGKTILIGAIIATEFAMAIEYPDGEFVENALVFAPGKTIIGSLRELAEVPYDEILPPRFYKRFAASFKLAFTRDGDPDVPVVRGSSFNVVVTNTEKIRIQKQPVRKKRGWTQLQLQTEEQRAEEVANRRLQSIASLPHLGVFSDEAHHTYGQDVEKSLKRVRQTVDYLADKTRLACVVNTTGTPYYKKQVLKDVVIWYGLARGIAEGILKEVEDSILAYRFDAAATGEFVRDVVLDFFDGYRDVALPDGASAKLAIYFPQTNDLEEIRPVVEATLSEIGLGPAVVLRNTSDSGLEEVDAFNRLNDPDSPYRVILLVNKGTEGWNCPSLFACALARKLKTSNNFVLQAASRCLRQVPGNDVRARIYISDENRATLDKQLQETYGETLKDLSGSKQNKKTATLRLKNPAKPPHPLTFTFTRRVIRRLGSENESVTEALALERPVDTNGSADSMLRTTYSIGERAGTGSVLRAVDDIPIDIAGETTDLYKAATSLASTYRLDALKTRRLLSKLYPDGEMPAEHLPAIATQVEEQTCRYEEDTETVTLTIEIVKPEGWFDTKSSEYATSISYAEDKEHLILNLLSEAENPHGFGFHYHPYNFDSAPEVSFFTQMLEHLNLNPDRVEDIYFTGAITDPKKTDFFVEWRDAANQNKRYFPDFIVRIKPEGDEPEGTGTCLIVEIKSEQFEKTVTAEMARGTATSDEGRKALAVKRLERLQPGKIEYEIIFAPAGDLVRSKTKRAREFTEGR